MAFSALGTGEGRVEPQAAATLMLNGVRDYYQTELNTGVAVMFSLPTYRDYEAFSAVLLTR